MRSALVSVIIPVFNPGPFLREALRSVMSQDMERMEVVVVDDCSSEDLSWIHSEFPTVRLLRQSHGGASIARNRGILNSTGDHIAFLDQDDVWRAQKLSRQVQALTLHTDAGVCFCGLELIDGEGLSLENQPVSRFGPGFPTVELDPKSDQLGDGSPLLRSMEYFSRRFIVPSSVMIRRSALATSGLLDPSIPFSGDYDLLIKLGSRHKVIQVHDVDVLYRKHGSNYSDQYDIGKREVEALISRYEAIARLQKDFQLLRRTRSLLERPPHIFAAQAIDCARRSLSIGDRRMFVRHLRSAVCFSPAFVAKSLGRWLLKRIDGLGANTRISKAEGAQP